MTSRRAPSAAPPARAPITASPRLGCAAMPRALQAEAPSRRRRDDALVEYELQALPARLRTVLLYGVLAWQSNLMEPVTEKCSSEAESDEIGCRDCRADGADRASRVLAARGTVAVSTEFPRLIPEGRRSVFAAAVGHTSAIL